MYDKVEEVFMGDNNNPFEFHETDLFIACVGENGGTDNFDIREGFKSSVNIMINAVENGEYEDTLIYPVVYNARHSVELSLKIILEHLIYIYDIKKQTFATEDKRKLYTHDIRLLDSIVAKYYLIDRRIVEKYDMVRPYLQDYYFDTKGDVFKYESDHNGNPHLIKLGISSISYDVLKRKYNEMMEIFDGLVFEMMYLSKEYGVGTFTKNLSREDLKNIAKILPPRANWREEIFAVQKEVIKKKYKIGSKEFSEALNIIQKHREFCVYIEMEQKLGNIPENELREYVKLVMEMNGEDLYRKNGTRVEYGNDLKIRLNEIQKKARKRSELSQNLSDETLVLLMVFREYGNSMELFTEKAEEILKYFGGMRLNRNDTLKKAEKYEVFRRILLGMLRCGQTTYHEIIKNEFENAGKELIEYEFAR